MCDCVCEMKLQKYGELEGGGELIKIDKGKEVRKTRQKENGN